MKKKSKKSKKKKKKKDDDLKRGTAAANCFRKTKRTDTLSNILSSKRMDYFNKTVKKI